MELSFPPSRITPLPFSRLTLEAARRSRECTSIGCLRSTVGRTSVLSRRSLTIYARLAAKVTIYVGKPSAAGQPTRPTQPFILLGSITSVVSYFIRCALVAPSGECSRGSSTVERRLWHAVYVLNPSVHSTALHGGCVSRPAWWLLVVLDCAVCQQSNKRGLLLLTSSSAFRCLPIVCLVFTYRLHGPSSHCTGDYYH